MTRRKKMIVTRSRSGTSLRLESEQISSQTLEHLHFLGGSVRPWNGSGYWVLKLPPGWSRTVDWKGQVHFATVQKNKNGSCFQLVHRSQTSCGKNKYKTTPKITTMQKAILSLKKMLRLHRMCPHQDRWRTSQDRVSDPVDGDAILRKHPKGSSAQSLPNEQRSNKSSLLSTSEGDCWLPLSVWFRKGRSRAFAVE